MGDFCCLTSLPVMHERIGPNVTEVVICYTRQMNPANTANTANENTLAVRPRRTVTTWDDSIVERWDGRFTPVRIKSKYWLLHLRKYDGL